jgi:hypothetical protein
MSKSLLVIAALLLPASSALAEQPGIQKSDKAALSDKVLPLKGASSGNSCAAYGPGFVKVAGSDTCVKVGGAGSVDVGTSRGAR